MLTYCLALLISAGGEGAVPVADPVIPDSIGAVAADSDEAAMGWRPAQPVDRDIVPKPVDAKPVDRDIVPKPVDAKPVDQDIVPKPVDTRPPVDDRDVPGDEGDKGDTGGGGGDIDDSDAGNGGSGGDGEDPRGEYDPTGDVDGDADSVAVVEKPWKRPPIDPPVEVADALGWLARHQLADGSWPVGEEMASGEHRYLGRTQNKAICSGWGLLSFLAVGIDPSADPDTDTRLPESTRPYIDHTKRAAEFVESLFVPAGEDGGRFGPYSYQAAVGLMAAAETLWALPPGHEWTNQLKPKVEAAVRYACDVQASSGGWRYQPGQDGDTSVTGWWVMALHSCELAGLTIPEETKEKARLWFTSRVVAKFDSQKSLTGSMDNTVWATGGYSNPNGTTNVSTAAVFCCRQFLGFGPDDPIVKGVSRTLLDEANPGTGGMGSWELYWRLPHTETEIQHFYFWYYEALGFYQMGENSPEWIQFEQKMEDGIAASQIQLDENDPFWHDLDGSWEPHQNGQPIGPGHWGRVGQTALGCLMLQASWRYGNIHEH